MRRSRRRGALLAVASAAYAAVLWYLTLRPQPYGEDVSGVVDALVRWFAASPVTAWLTFPIVEFTANVALFVPFGVLGMWWAGRAWLVVPAALATSGAIELAQLLFLPSRVADPRDLVANTLGALVGVAALAGVIRASRSRKVPARREEG